MAKYKKRADGRYQAKITTPEIDLQTGKRKVIFVYGKSISELERNRSKVLDELEKNIYVSNKSVMFCDYKEQWLRIYKAGRSHNTIAGYENILKNHVAGLDDKKLIDIKKSDVQAGYNALNGHPDLQRRYYQTVHQILKAAMGDGLLYRNVADGIEKTKTPRRKKRALTELERSYITIIDSYTPQEKLLVYLLLYTGMRRQEVIPLTRFDIDFTHGMISVNKAITFVGEEAVLKDTKSESGVRKIFILDPLLPILKEYVKTMSGTLLFPGNNGNSYLTKTQYRNLFDGIKRKLNTACGGSHHWKNGKVIYDVDMCAGLGSHTFRHEFATMLYYSGIDIMEAVDMMGHSDSKMMIDTYAELRKQEKKSKDKLNSFIKKSSLK